MFSCGFALRYVREIHSDLDCPATPTAKDAHCPGQADFPAQGEASTAPGAQDDQGRVAEGLSSDCRHGGGSPSTSPEIGRHAIAPCLRSPTHPMLQPGKGAVSSVVDEGWLVICVTHAVSYVVSCVVDFGAYDMSYVVDFTACDMQMASAPGNVRIRSARCQLRGAGVSGRRARPRWGVGRRRLP